MIYVLNHTTNKEEKKDNSYSFAISKIKKIFWVKTSVSDHRLQQRPRNMDYWNSNYPCAIVFLTFFPDISRNKNTYNTNR